MVFANSGWSRAWKEVSVSSLARLRSDHNTILVKFDTKRRNVRRKERLYRFEQMWQNESECDDVVSHSCKKGGNLIANIDRIGANLEMLGREKFGNLSKKT